MSDAFIWPRKTQGTMKKKMQNDNFTYVIYVYIFTIYIYYFNHGIDVVLVF